MKFYATPPSRARLEEDILAFVSLLRWSRDEQADRMVLSSAGPGARSLHEALAGAGVLSAVEDASFEGPWREGIDDPLDPYAPDGSRRVEFTVAKGAPLRARCGISWRGEPSGVTGSFGVEARGAGFTLGFAGFSGEKNGGDGKTAARSPALQPGRRARPRRDP